MANARVEHISSADGVGPGRWRVGVPRSVEGTDMVPTLVALERGQIMRAQYPYKHADSSAAAVKTTGVFQRRRALRLREYQQRAVSQVFRHGHARSGVIVLPCGAGKTPTGVCIACEIGQATLVVVPDAVTRTQWRNQFLACTDLDAEDVAFLGDDQYSQIRSNPYAPVIIATYQKLVASPDSGGLQAQTTIEEKRILAQRTFGLMILDECHNAAAPKYRTVLDKIASARCVVGLTATLVREDNKISTVLFIIGPRLYEANWLHLVQCGYLAAVQCVEVHCPLPRAFQRRLMDPGRNDRGDRSSAAMFEQLLFALNPTKLWVLQTLVRFHEARGDKVLVFVEKPWIAWLLGRWLLHCPFLAGGEHVAEVERHGVINHFRHHPDIKTMVATKVLDCGIDVPDANVVIQVQFYGKSRVQEAQRLGRILRPKPRIAGVACNAFFYVLVVPDSNERTAAALRQRFLQENSFEYVRFDASKILQESPRVFGPGAPPAVGYKRLERMACTTDAEIERLLTWIDNFHRNPTADRDKFTNPFTGESERTSQSKVAAPKKQRMSAADREAEHYYAKLAGRTQAAQQAKQTRVQNLVAMRHKAEQRWR